MGTMGFTSPKKNEFYTKPEGSQCDNYKLQHG